MTHELVCPACRQPNRAAARFCRHCGRAVRGPGGGLVLAFLVSCLVGLAWLVTGIAVVAEPGMSRSDTELLIGVAGVAAFFHFAAFGAFVREGRVTSLGKTGLVLLTLGVLTGAVCYAVGIQEQVRRRKAAEYRCDDAQTEVQRLQQQLQQLQPQSDHVRRSYPWPVRK